MWLEIVCGLLGFVMVFISKFRLFCLRNKFDFGVWILLVFFFWVKIIFGNVMKLFV